MTGVQWKPSVSMQICWMRCQPLGRVLRFAKAWLRLRQRTQTEECSRYSPLCGERQRNVGCQATYCTLTPINTARGLEPCRKAGATDPTVTMPLTTSMCDIIPISAGQCWFNPARLSKHWGSYWRVPDWLSHMVYIQNGLSHNHLICRANILLFHSLSFSESTFIIIRRIYNLTPAQYQLTRHLTHNSKSFPARASSFTVVLQPWSLIQSERLKEWLHMKHTAETERDGGQDGRWTSSFTSYMRVQSSDSVREC